MKIKPKLPAITFTVTLLMCCTQQVTWEKIKETNKVYPKDTIITYDYIFLTDTVKAWVNTSYKNYPYKEFNETKTEVFFDLTNPEVQAELGQDSLRMAQILLELFRKKGATHFVGQGIMNNEMTIVFYADDNVYPLSALRGFPLMLKAEIVPDDKNWKRYSDMLKIYESEN